jgi:hypothetical protein
MFDPITLGLIGSAIGGLTSKKPLKGALLGGAMGAGGGLLAGGMGGAGVAGDAMMPGLLGANAPMAAFNPMAPQGMAGMMSQAKPFMDAASTGMQVAGSMNQPEQAPPPPQLPQQMGAQTLQQLAQGNPQANVMAEAEMRKKRRMGLLGGM